MKKILNFSFLIIVLFTFYGCPVGINYPVGIPGEEKIDNELIGVWTNFNEDAEVKSIKLTKKDNYSYNVEVIERGELYAIDTNFLTGWISQIDGKKFLYFKPDNEEFYYHYMIQDLKKNKMTTCDVSLLDGGIETVTSTEKLREQVQNSMKKAAFCNEVIEWTKN